MGSPSATHGAQEQQHMTQAKSHFANLETAPPTTHTSGSKCTNQRQKALGWHTANQLVGRAPQGHTAAHRGPHRASTTATTKRGTGGMHHWQPAPALPPWRGARELHNVRGRTPRARGTQNPRVGEQADRAGAGPHGLHPQPPIERGRSNTATQDAGATPRGTGESAADKEERGGQRGRGGSKDSGGNRELERGGGESVRMGGSDNTGDGLASQPRRYRLPG